MSHTSLKTYLTDQVAPQLEALTWYRFWVLQDFIVRGPIRTLNIGTGGGVETLRLLAAGNRVTSVEYDADTYQRTEERIRRNRYAGVWKGYHGHVLDVDVDGPFHVVWMTEVLEHIKDDHLALKRISSWLEPGGRLVMSTPTASYGQIGEYTTLSAEEDGAHVRVGYDGPELDKMLESVGLTTVNRLYIGNTWVQWLHRLEKRVGVLNEPARYLLSTLLRLLMPIADRLPPYRPFGQITLATKQGLGAESVN